MSMIVMCAITNQIKLKFILSQTNIHLSLQDLYAAMFPSNISSVSPIFRVGCQTNLFYRPSYQVKKIPEVY